MRVVAARAGGYALHVVVERAVRRGACARWTVADKEGAIRETGCVAHLGRLVEGARVLERVVGHGKWARNGVDETRRAALAATNEEPYSHCDRGYDNTNCQEYTRDRSSVSEESASCVSQTDV